MASSGNGGSRHEHALTRAFVQGSVWIGIGTAAQAGLRLALIAVLSKYFGRSLYGFWALLVATVDILAPLATLGLTYGYMRHYAGRHEGESAHRDFLGATIVVLAVGGTLSLAFAALASGFADAFMDGAQTGRRVVLAGSAMVLWSSLETFLRFYYGTRLQMGRRTLLAVSRFALELLAVVVGALAGLGLVQVVMLALIARAVPPLVSLARILRRHGLPRPAFGRVFAGISFGLPLQLAGAAGIVMRVCDRYVLGTFRPVGEVGAYSATYDISAFLLLAVVTLGHALFPVLSALLNRGERDLAAWAYRVAVKYFLLVAVPSAAVLTVAARPILAVVTTGEMAELGAKAAPLIAWGAVFYGVSILARTLVAVRRHTVAAMVVLWVGAALKLVLLVFLVQWHGLPGAGLATFGGFFVLMVAMLAMVRITAARQEAEPVVESLARAHGFTHIVLAAAAAAVPLHLIATDDPLRLLAGLGAFGAVYAVAVLALGAVRREEIQKIWRLLRAGGDGGQLQAAQ